MQMKHLSNSSGQSTNLASLLRKIMAFVASVALLVLVLMFSAVLLTIIVFFVVIAGVYLWWKTRAIRKQLQQMRAQMQNFAQQGAAKHRDPFAGESFKGEVYEGEVVRAEVSLGRK
jgi:Flp pilus assembly protein TadB